MTAVREPADHLRRPPTRVVLPVVIPETEVELVQLREARQDRQHLVAKEEVHEAGAVDPITRRGSVIAVRVRVGGPNVNRDGEQGRIRVHATQNGS